MIELREHTIVPRAAHRVMAVCEPCVHIALGLADFSDARAGH
jgi:hypothetical protein